ncbi:MAG: succinate dehydrogenase, hydrophobic membrane anchor protein [Porticoccaceae bacterium]|nr:succinate dehydrogenase, hydrophobic membrane anchor protein [Porticoccaceae bacterium]|tara:strand:+ start:225 stop:593 length:369 start_codon:yes stop_codon:yes gene_type:complete
MNGLTLFFLRSGSNKWLLQRFAAVIVLSYIVFLICVLIIRPEMDYSDWVNLNKAIPMRFFSFLTVLSLSVHAWIGMWCVFTDYITVRLIGPKADFIRKGCILLLTLTAAFYVLWVFKILWSI